MSKQALVARLEKALRTHRLVRIERSPRNADRVDGFVVGLGSKWALLATTRDGGFLDWLAAIRIRDVSAVHRDTSFEERFAKTQADWPPSAPDVDLDKTATLLRDLAKTAPLVSIGQERRYKFDGRWIGVVDEVEAGYLWLREVRPDATWKPHPLGYKLSRISYIETGSAYLFGLNAIAGRPGED